MGPNRWTPWYFFLIADPSPTFSSCDHPSDWTCWQRLCRILLPPGAIRWMQHQGWAGLPATEGTLPARGHHAPGGVHHSQRGQNLGHCFQYMNEMWDSLEKVGTLRYSYFQCIWYRLTDEVIWTFQSELFQEEYTNLNWFAGRLEIADGLTGALVWYSSSFLLSFYTDFFSHSVICSLGWTTLK